LALIPDPTRNQPGEIAGLFCFWPSIKLFVHRPMDKIQAGRVYGAGEKSIPARGIRFSAQEEYRHGEAASWL
jgi:hypothetical protein